MDNAHTGPRVQGFLIRPCATCAVFCSFDADAISKHYMVCHSDEFTYFILEFLLNLRWILAGRDEFLWFIFSVYLAMKYHVILGQIFTYGNLPKSFFTKCAKKIHPAFVQSLCLLWIVRFDDPSDFVSLPALGEKMKKVCYSLLYCCNSVLKSSCGLSYCVFCN